MGSRRRESLESEGATELEQAGERESGEMLEREPAGELELEPAGELEPEPAGALEPAGELELEMDLDRVEAELAAELPGHMRAFARAHAAGAPAPPAPAAVRRTSVAALARRAVAYPALAARGLALLRLVVPVLVEGDPAVARARAAAPMWPSLAALAAAREAASRVRFGLGFVEIVHALHGAPAVGAPAPGRHESLALREPLEPREAMESREAMEPRESMESRGPLALRAALEPPAGWTEPDRAAGATGAAEIDAIWRELARCHGAAGRLELVASAAARPRAFVVEPGREVIAVVPARVETPAARFAVLHELGHALAGLIAPAALPRAVDEAAASYAARAMEASAHPWHSPLAAAARARRTALAAALDELERAGASSTVARAPAAQDPLLAGTRPPWALWHDPGAQASYVRAEQIADRWAEEAGSPLARRLASESAAVAGSAVAALLGRA